MTSSLRILNDAAFSDFLQLQESPALIVFTGEWSQPGEEVSTQVLELAAANPGLQVAAVDVDRSPDLVREYGVKTVPTTLVIGNGQVLDTIGGTPPRPHLIQRLARHIPGVRFLKTSTEVLAQQRALQPTDFPRATVSRNLIPVTDSTFADEVLRSKQPALVAFWVDWSVKCHAVLPMIDIIASTYLGRLKVTTVDIEQNPVAGELYGIDLMPIVVLFNRGRPVEYLADVSPEDGAKLGALIDPHVPPEPAHISYGLTSAFGHEWSNAG